LEVGGEKASVQNREKKKKGKGMSRALMVCGSSVPKWSRYEWDLGGKGCYGRQSNKSRIGGREGVQFGARLLEGHNAHIGEKRKKRSLVNRFDWYFTGRERWAPKGVRRMNTGPIKRSSQQKVEGEEEGGWPIKRTGGLDNQCLVVQ